MSGPGAVGVGVVVLCGGTSRRFGGGDKTAAPFGASTVLGELVAALPAGPPVVCVGEPRPLPREVTWTREVPPLGGPLAAIAAGLRRLDDTIEVVVVLAGDQPFAGALAPRLATELGGSGDDVDVVAACGHDGRPQLLLAAYRASALRSALGTDPAGRGVYATLGQLRVTCLDVETSSIVDIDTRDDLDRARDDSAEGTD